VFSRLTFTNRTVRSNQLTGEHLIGQRSLLDWNVTSNGVSRDEPDRSDIGYQARTGADGTLVPDRWFGQPRFATRTYSNLSENAWNLALNYRYALGNVQDPINVKVGAWARFVNRTAASRPYDIINVALPDSALAQQPETIFSPQNVDASNFTLRVNAFGGDYTAKDEVVAGYVQAEWPVSDRLQLIGGLRVEQWALDVTSLTSQGVPALAQPRNTDLLPAIAATFRLTSDQNLRASVTQTLSRPEYRELSSVPYFEQVGFFVTTGNPNLQRALIQNYDLRWEWFPRAGEVLSVGVFAKQFSQPIEKVIVQAAGTNTLSFVNANGGTNLGVELEARKSLDFIGEAFRPFSMFTNVTLMSSQIEIGNDSISALTNPDRPMVGQSPYLVNVGLNWTPSGGRWNASLLYNVQGERIIEAGSGGLPDAYEQPRNMLDLAFQGPVTRQLLFQVTAKNLLDAPYRLVQGDVVRQRFLTGRILAFGLRWQP
jgi:TonB-dependent receptor